MGVHSCLICEVFILSVAASPKSFNKLAAKSAPRAADEASVPPESTTAITSAKEARPRVRVGSVAFDRLSMPETVAEIVLMASQNSKPNAVFTGNLDHMAQLRRDNDFKAAYADADLILADGMPLVWLSRIGPSGQRLTERVTGSDLFWELAEASHETGLRLFFLGGADGAADGAAEAVRKRFPNVVIVGTYCPPRSVFETENEQAKIHQMVQAAKPDVLMVALGAPKQEKWIMQNKALLQVPVCVGVGGSFEMASGKIKRAPVWMQKSGLEWSFRLTQEPTRLWRRYLLRDVPVLFSLAAQQVKCRRAAQNK